MFGIGLPELVIIIIVALLVVGPARLPEVARSLGKALGEFRRLADDVKETIEREMTAEEEKEQPGAIGEKEEEKETAETHQVIYFTCHPEIAGLFRSRKKDIPVYSMHDGQITRD